MSVVYDYARKHSKSLVALGVAAGLGYAIANRDYCWNLLRNRPYAPTNSNFVFRFIQRLLIDKTRKNISGEIFPLDSLVPIQKRHGDNGHAIAGQVRDAARNTIARTVEVSGRKHFEISPAKQSDPDSAIHYHYATADLERPIEWSPIHPNSIIVGIDVDYYLTHPDWLLGCGEPCIFFTFNPTEVSGLDGDCTYTIKDNRIRYEVGGGGDWQHQVWDWCAPGEFVIGRPPGILHWFLRLFGIEKVIVQKIHQARPWPDCPNRVLVWTIPQFSFWKLRGASDLRLRELKRVNYQDSHRPGWNIFTSVDVDRNLVVSLGREGNHASLTMPKTDYDTLIGCRSHTSVTSRMLAMGYKDTVVINLFGQYFTNSPARLDEPEIATRAMQERPWVHWAAACMADIPEVNMRQYSPPLVSDANLAPMIRRWESMTIALDRRVNFAANRKAPEGAVSRHASEFIKLVVPNDIMHSGQPYNLEDTAGMLDKPSQSAAIKMIWDTLDLPHRELIESFIKNEPTNKASRIISSFPDMRFLLKFSSFTLAFRDKVLHAPHNSHWFVPGKAPADIVAMVRDYVGRVAEPIEGDFSNFDGSVSRWCHKQVMNAVYHRFFAPESQAELRGYTDMLVSCPARAKKFGFRYEAGVGVKSGSPTTCDLNSVLNAFIQYSAVRHTYPELKPAEAFQHIGLAFGDDSIFSSDFKQQFVKVADVVGLTLKVERYDPAQGLTFLGRVFLDPFTTDSTIQDPLRTWRKLHMTARDPCIPLATAAVDRLEGYLVTDPLTPVTSEYAQAVIRLVGDDAEDRARRQARKSHNAEKPYWLTSGTWPQREEDHDLMVSVISARTGITEEAIRNMQRHLETLEDLAALQTFDREYEPGYEDTLDPDGQPLGGVDPRFCDKTKLVNHKQTLQDDIAQVISTAARGGKQRFASPPGSDGVLEAGAPGPGSIPGAGSNARVRPRKPTKAAKHDQRHTPKAGDQQLVGEAPGGNRRPKLQRQSGVYLKPKL